MTRTQITCNDNGMESREIEKWMGHLTASSPRDRDGRRSSWAAAASTGATALAQHATISIPTVEKQNKHVINQPSINQSSINQSSINHQPPKPTSNNSIPSIPSIPVQVSKLAFRWRSGRCQLKPANPLHRPAGARRNRPSELRK